MDSPADTGRSVASLISAVLITLLLVSSAEARFLEPSTTLSSEMTWVTPADSTGKSLLFRGIFVSSLPTGLSHAGTFSTWGYHIFGPPDETVHLRTRMNTPPGWTIISRQSTIELVRGQTRVLPFTVWIPEDASADTRFETSLELVDDYGEVVASSTREIEVAALYELSLQQVGELDLISDERTSVLAEVRNNGNCRAKIRVRAESRHEWEVVLDPETVELGPGETTNIEVSVVVPPAVRIGSNYTMDLTARIETEGLAFSPSQQVAISGVVRSPRTTKSHYRRLPVRVQSTWERYRGGEARKGLRISSEGNVGSETRFGVEMDLEGGSPNEEAWRSQFLRVDMGQQSWELSAGDVTERFPEAATGSVSGRGLLWHGRRGAWDSRGFFVQNRSRHEKTTFGVGTSRRFQPELRTRLDFVRQRRAATTLLSEESVDLYTLSGDYEAGKRFALTLEASLSRSDLDQYQRSGRGGHADLRYRDSRWTIRARAFAGDGTFRGRNRDRDGYLGHATFNLRSSASFWASLDGSNGESLQPGDPLRTSAGNQRLGLRLYPSKGTTVDVSLGRGRNQQIDVVPLLDVDKRDLVATAWQSIGQFSISATTRIGRTHNQIEDTRGKIRALGLTAGGGWRRARAVFGWNQEREEVPGTPEDRDVTALTGDVSWSSARARLRLGLGLNARTFGTMLGSNQVGWETAYRPRLEAGISDHVRLRLDADLRRSTVPLELRRSRISVTWSADEAVPIFWSPIRGGIRTIAFVDSDLDGRYSPGEETISGVIFVIEGDQQISDDFGEANWPPVRAGSYWLELDRSSLPRELIPSESFPRFLSVTSGEDLTILVPLVRTCAVSGTIFHDRNHDSRQEPDEGGVEDVQITLLRDDEIVARGMSDPDGRYHFDRLRPGQYQLRVEETRLPDNWVATGRARTMAELGRGSRTTSQSFGVAQKRRRIITTYHGGSERSEAEPTPESLPSDQE